MAERNYCDECVPGGVRVRDVVENPFALCVGCEVSAVEVGGLLAVGV